MTGIYARQSVFHKDSVSIETQIELCKRQIDDDTIVYQDAGFSGKNTNRPEFRRLMADVESGKINRVVCYRIDRISRSIADFGKIWETLDAHNVAFTSITEQFDTSTPIGRAMLYIIMVFAQLERETTAQRVTDNYYKRTRDGAWPGGPAPFGYKIIKRKIDGKNKSVLERNDDITYVIRMFEQYATGVTSLGRIAKQMREERIGEAEQRVWTNIAIARILENPVYAQADADLYSYYQAQGAQIDNPLSDFDGSRSALLIGYRHAETRKRRDITQQHLILTQTEGVVPSEVFIRVQDQLSKNQQIKNSKGSRFSWLSGLLKCAECGYSMKVQYDKKSDRVYYYCSNKYGGTHTCTARHSERPEIVEAYVARELTERISKIASGNADAIEPADAVRLNALKLQLIDIQNRQRNLVEAIAAGGAAAIRLLTPELEKLDAESSAVSKEIDTLNRKRPQWIPNSYVDIESLDFEEKRTVAKQMIEKIRVLNDEIEIIWK